MFDTDSNPLQTPSNNPEPPKDPTVLPTIEITDVSVDSSKTTPTTEEVSMWSFTPPTVTLGPSEKIRVSPKPTSTDIPVGSVSTTGPISAPTSEVSGEPAPKTSTPQTSPNPSVTSPTSAPVTSSTPISSPAEPKPSTTPTTPAFSPSTAEKAENATASMATPPAPPVSYAPVSEPKANKTVPPLSPANQSSGVPAGPTSFPYGSPTPPTPLREQPVQPASPVPANYQVQQPVYPNGQPMNTGYIAPPVFPQQPPAQPNPYGGYQGQPANYPPQQPVPPQPQPAPQPYGNYQTQQPYGGYQTQPQQQMPPSQPAQPMGYGMQGQPTPAGQPPMYAVPQAPVKKEGKSKAIAAILCLFGPLGVHRFYLGYIGRGIIYAALTVVGLFLTWIPGWMYAVQSSYKGYGASAGAVDVSRYNIFYYIGLVVLIVVLVLVILDFVKILTGKMKTKAGKDLY